MGIYVAIIVILISTRIAHNDKLLRYRRLLTELKYSYIWSVWPKLEMHNLLCYVRLITALKYIAIYVVYSVHEFHGF